MTEISYNYRMFRLIPFFLVLNFIFLGCEKTEPPKEESTSQEKKDQVFIDNILEKAGEHMREDDKLRNKQSPSPKNP